MGGGAGEQGWGIRWKREGAASHVGQIFLSRIQPGHPPAATGSVGWNLLGPPGAQLWWRAVQPRTRLAPVRCVAGAQWGERELIDIDWSVWTGGRRRHSEPEQRCLKRPPRSTNANRIDLGPIFHGETAGLLLLRRSRESSVFSSPEKSKRSSRQSTVGPPAPGCLGVTSGPRSNQEVDSDQPSGVVLRWCGITSVKTFISRFYAFKVRFHPFSCCIWSSSIFICSESAASFISKVR